MDNKCSNVFVCYTPFQILNSLNIVYHNVNETKGTSDIYVEKSFTNAENFIKGLQESRIFNNVYSFLARKSNWRWKQKIETAVGTLFPSYSLEHCIQIKNDLCDKEYLHVYSSVWGLFVTNIIDFYGISSIYLFEDGTASYEQTLEAKIPKSYKLFSKIFNRGCANFTAQVLFLNCPALYQEKERKKIRELPKTREQEYLKLCKRVFHYNEQSSFLKYKYFYMSIPVEEIRGCKISSEEQFYRIEELEEKIVVRLHPRQSDMKESNCIIDRGKNLWELEAAEISEEHVLISYYSTTLFTPKMLYDKEPYLIFLYHIWRQKNDSTTERIEVAVENIKKIYKNKQKIFEPKSMEEYKTILLMLKSEG